MPVLFPLESEHQLKFSGLNAAQKSLSKICVLVSRLHTQTSQGTAWAIGGWLCLCREMKATCLSAVRSVLQGARAHSQGAKSERCEAGACFHFLFTKELAEALRVLLCLFLLPLCEMC